MPLAAGDRLGHYEITSLLGQGGMGEVYRARDTKLGREVAIKILPAAMARDPERLARFEREAKVLAALNHPNIAVIYGLEEKAIVMELVEGPTLSERIGEGLQLQQSLRIALQVAEALEAAHEKGIVHRDLKPANVKAPQDGPVKVLDLGLATALPGGGRDGESQNISNSPTLTMGATEAGVILGTAAYMSPEQASGRRVDKRADIWSFGVLLWEMLTGKRLFQGETVSHTLADVLRANIDVAKVSAPAPIRELVRRCLDRDTKTRLRDIGEARVAIAEYLANPKSGDEVTADARSHSKLAWTIAGVMTVAATGIAAMWLRPAPLPQVMRFEIHAPTGSTLPLGTPAPSPDGRTIAYTVRGSDGVTRIHLRPIDRVETRVLPGTEGAIHPFWSADGRSLGFATAAARPLKVIDVAGGNPRALVDVNGPWHGSWNQFGDILFEGVGGPARIAAEGGTASLVAKADAKKGEAAGGFPLFLEDGRRFLVTFREGTPSIQLATLGSDERHVVVEGINSAAILAPVPTGKTYLLYLRGSDLIGQEFDQHSGTVQGRPVLIVSNIGRVANPAIRPSVGAANGMIAYQAGGQSAGGVLSWFDRSGKAGESLPEEASGTNIELSPDGTEVAIDRIDDTGNADIWVTDLKRRSAARLTFAPTRDVVGSWSPDGKQLAYETVDGGEVHIIDVGDTTKNRALTNAHGRPSSWSADGKYLIVSYQGNLQVVPISGEKPIRVGSPNGTSDQGRFSPDAKYIAFRSDQSGQREIYVEPVPPGTGLHKISIGGGTAPRWRRDGKELYFVSPEGGMMAVDVKLDGAFSAGVPHELFRNGPRAFASGYDVGADGREFLTFDAAQVDQDSPITVVLNWWTEFFK